MSSDNIRPLLLEDLPSEIFLQIFNFFSLGEIVIAFSDLNSYIDSITRLVRHVSHTVKYNDNNGIKLLDLFSTHIHRLAVFSVEIADFTSLNNLHSLTLKYSTKIQVDNIRPEHFPLLEILHIEGYRGLLSDEKPINSLLQVLLSNGFPRLRICTMFDVAGILHFSKTWKGSPNLRSLNLKLGNLSDYEQLRSICPRLRRLTTYRYPTGDPPSVPGILAARRIFGEIKRLERLVLENKLVIDVNPTIPLYDNQKMPSRFNNTTTPPCPDPGDISVLQARIFPRSEPYCRASFLIEIKFPQEYPFKAPIITFLDPIYHPSVHEFSSYFSDVEAWKPTTLLTDIIERIIHIIDKKPDYSHMVDYKCYQEYQNDYQTFYNKALELTLSYGRPRS